MTDELKKRMIDNIWSAFNNRIHRFYENTDLIPEDAFFEVDSIFKDDVKPAGKNKLWVSIYFTVKKIDEDGKCYISKSSTSYTIGLANFLLEARWGETIIKDIKQINK